jgi:hypothetical protein
MPIRLDTLPNEIVSRPGLIQLSLVDRLGSMDAVG